MLPSWHSHFDSCSRSPTSDQANRFWPWVRESCSSFSASIDSNMCWRNDIVIVWSDATILHSAVSVCPSVCPPYWCWRCRHFNISWQLSAISSTSCLMPVKQRVEFKQALFVYKVLRQTAPQYLADMCRPVSTSSTRRHLRSAAHGDLWSCDAEQQHTESEVFL